MTEAPVYEATGLRDREAIYGQTGHKLAKDGSRRGRPQGGVAAAARKLGIPRTTVRRALKATEQAEKAAAQVYTQGLTEAFPVLTGTKANLRLAAEMAGFLAALVDMAGTRPDGWPSTVTLWRGGHGPDVASGWSWTTDRPTACFFAGYDCSGGAIAGFREQPIVLRAKVPVERIMHVDDERGEHEAVIPGGVPEAVIDGTPEEWKATAGRRAAEAAGVAV